MIKNKVAIGIRGCIFDKWVSNWQECLDTWAGDMIEHGWRVKVHIGHPELDIPYKDLGPFFMCKTTENNKGVFMKSVYFPAKWLVEQDQYSHIFITDSDSFIHRQRFERTIEHLFHTYVDLDFVGAVRPCPGINLGSDYSIKIDLNNHQFGESFKFLYASGGSGFLLSKKSAVAIINAIENEEYLNYEGFNNDWLYYDDLLLGRIMKYSNISLIHSNSFQSTSPKINDILHYKPAGIENENGSFFAVQHYRNGDMMDIMKKLQLCKERLFSVIIPTMWRSNTTIELLNRLENSEYVGQIIIIDNAPSLKPDLSQYNKIKYLTKGENIYVNPAWNWGVSESNNELLCICNDDILFNVDNAFKYVSDNQDYLGVMGTNLFSINTNVDKNWVIPGHHIERGWGVLMFTKKSRWINIPDSLKIFFGDNWIVNHITPCYNLSIAGGVFTIMSTTSSDLKFNKITEEDITNWQNTFKFI